MLHCSYFFSDRSSHLVLHPFSPFSLAYLTYVAITTIAFIVLYSIDITALSNGLGWTIEQSIAAFYLLSLIVYFTPIFPGDECRISFNRLLRVVFWPGATISFPEVLLADALCSVSKVLKDFGTTIVAIYAAFSNQNILEFHNSAMILVALLASLPFW